jgi:peptidyl-prolyl cis-trans isomerase B (cyclophilin B)
MNGEAQALNAEGTMKRTAVVVAAMLLAMAACQTNAGKKEATPHKETAMTATETKTKTWVEPKTANVDVTKKYLAVIRTSKGTIECELFAKDAPLSVTNFKYLADGGFYNGLTFHRVEPGFVVQGGDPTATGTGGPGYTIAAEIGRKHGKGALAWARTGDAVNPERRSSGSQFYITLAPTPFLDGGYTVFGQTVKGMDVVEKLQRGDTIESIEVKVE